MKTKHTPGPWHYSNYAATFMLQDGPYYEDNLILSYDESFSSINEETAKANAKLAAAAPELLESLVKILQNFKSCIAGGNGELETDKEDIAKAEVAIKKATE